MEDELKPCPFCGGKAYVYQCPEDKLISSRLWNMWVVGCDGEPVCPGYAWKASPIYVTAESAIEHWNRRVEQIIEQVHCKDCKHYAEDVLAYADHNPVIVAHGACKVWGGPIGSKTDPDGWCYLGVRKEDECSQ